MKPYRISPTVVREEDSTSKSQQRCWAPSVTLWLQQSPQHHTLLQAQHSAPPGVCCPPLLDRQLPKLLSAFSCFATAAVNIQQMLPVETKPHWFLFFFNQRLQTFGCLHGLQFQALGASVLQLAHCSTLLSSLPLLPLERTWRKVGH